MICKGASRLNNGKALSAFRQFHAEINSLKAFYTDLRALGMFADEVNGFKRMSVKSKRILLGAALALFDAEIKPAEHGRNFGVINSNLACCEADNRRYFEDYVQYDRIMGRGNLFVNTLPTTPAAEVTMAFNLHGPLYFITTVKNHLAALLYDAELLLKSGDADKVMVILDTPEDIVTLIFVPGQAVIDYRRYCGNVVELFNCCIRWRKKTQGNSV